MKKAQLGTILIIAFIVVIAIVVVYFVYNNTNNTPGQVNSPNTATIQNFAFSPATLSINLGDTVTWTNKDQVQHTVTSDSGNELDSPLFGNSQTYTHTFNTPGTFNYHCTPHPNMKATIIVT